MVDAPSVRVMRIQVTQTQVLLMSDRPDTLTCVVRALEVAGHQVILALTFSSVVEWLEVATPCCLIAHRPTLTMTDIAVLQSFRWWAKQTPLVVVTAVPAPAALRSVLETRRCSVVPLCASPENLCRAVATMIRREETT
jgi:DNA-binding NtrC family response regulator